MDFSAFIFNFFLRSFLAGLLVFFARETLGEQDALIDSNIPPYGLEGEGLPGRQVILHDKRFLVMFDSLSGALTRLEDNKTHWVLERRPELGVSFRMFAPLPDRNYNPIFGQAQRVARMTQWDNRRLCITWTNVFSQNGGHLPIAFTSTVVLTNGLLNFTAELSNHSTLEIDSVDYPYFGDLSPPALSPALHIKTMRNKNPVDIQNTEIYPHFINEHGYWGDFFPLITREVQQSMYCLIQSPDEGCLVAVDFQKAAYRIQYTFELHPGVNDSVYNVVPPGDNICGIPVHLEFRLCHFVWLKPGKSIKLASVAVSFFQNNQKQYFFEK